MTVALHPVCDPHTIPSMDPRQELARGLDATLNRLGEALRTVEDRLRFDRTLPTFPARWKALRRQVGDLRQRLEDAWGPTALWRDVTGDPGGPVPDARGPVRAGTEDLLTANVARAREAARSVEEALRAAALPELAARAEEIRYEIYRTEAATLGLLQRGRRLADVRLYVLLTTNLTARPPLETAAAAIRGGAQMLQLREKDMPNREFLALARQLRELTAELGALLIINDRVEIAALCGADGVHQGQDDLPPAEARKIIGPDRIIGVSTHDEEQARRAEEEGADYIGIGPIFPTRTKEHRAAVGPRAIAAASRVTSIPGFAIGSVNRETLPEVIAAGAGRIAVCTGIISHANPEKEARWYREQLDAAAARS